MWRIKLAGAFFQNFFAERLFYLCDPTNSGTTDIPKLINPLVKVTKGTPTQRLEFLFDIYDVHGMVNFFTYYFETRYTEVLCHK